MKKKCKLPEELPVESNPLVVTDEDRLRYAQLVRLVKEHPVGYACILTGRSNQVRKRLAGYGFSSMEDKDALAVWIAAKTPLLAGPEYLAATKCLWIFRGMTDFPVCPVCPVCGGKAGVGRNFSFSRGYGRCCCKECAHRDGENYRKGKETKLRKYGCYFNNRPQAAETCREKYGDDITNPSQLQSVKDQKAQTSMDHYGVPNPNQDPSVRAAIEATNMTTYGCKSPLQNDEIKERIAQTNLKNLGVRNPFELRYPSERGLESRRRKYGSVKGNKRRYVYADGIVCDSSWELCVLIYCLDHGISIEREPARLQYVKNGRHYWYYPDFRIDGQLVEIKGDNFFDKDGRPMYNGKHSWAEKYECMLANGVKMFRKAEIKPYLKYVQQTYGRKYIAQFRITKTDAEP